MCSISLNFNFFVLFTGYRCDCAPGWTGRLCDVQINHCESQPCKNGGACRNELTRYVCVCLTEFTGVDCSIRKNPCDQVIAVEII